MRKLLLLLTTLFTFSVAFAQNPVVSITTVKDNQSKNCTGYSADAQLTNSEDKTQTWSTYGFNFNNGNWGDIRCGNKSATNGYTATITTDFAVPASINKVEIELKHIKAGTNDKLTSITLNVSDNSDMSSATDYSFSDADITAFNSMSASTTTSKTISVDVTTPGANTVCLSLCRK